MSITWQQKYQEGSIDRVARAKGPDVWVYRWRETSDDGKRVQRKRVIGTVKQFPSESAGKRAVDNLRAQINSDQDHLGQKTISELWGHFQAHELWDPDVDRSPTTIDSYLDKLQALHCPPMG